MHLINVETLRLERFIADSTPPYAILSHTWGSEKEELSFADIEGGNTRKAGCGANKLKGCCAQAKKDNLEWVWIDTCCIDKQSSSELGEAINSMFQWYRNAAICYAYLSDVPHGDDHRSQRSKLSSSRWFQRGWTLQELIAPEELWFYDQDWKPIGTKADMAKAIGVITGIPWRFLIGWEDIRQASVAQRMFWAAKRKVSRREDAAYCLLGIFNITMPMIYGEGDRALTRLQQEIIKNSRDDSILAWGIDPAAGTPKNSADDAVSAGILATAPSQFANCGGIIRRNQTAAPVDSFDISGGRFRIHIALYTTSAGETYGLLNSGPEYNADEVVGIPLIKISGAATDEYLRPLGRCAVFLPRPATSDLMTKYIHVKMERQSKVNEAMGQRLWLHIDGHREISLKLEEDYPPVLWKKGRALIAETGDLDGNVTRRHLARFRTHGEGTQDIIVVLEFELQGSQPQARSHVMSLPRGTVLEELSRKFAYLSPELLGNQAASIDNLHVEVTVEQQWVAREPILFVGLAAASSSPNAHVNAHSELEQASLKLEIMKILQEGRQYYLATIQSIQQKNKEAAALDETRKQLAVLDDELRELIEKRRELSDAVEKGVQQVAQLKTEVENAVNQGYKRSKRQEEIQQRLDELEINQGSGNWLETLVKPLLGAGKIIDDLNDIAGSDSSYQQVREAKKKNKAKHMICGQTPLSWATMNDYEAMAKLLLDKGADIEEKNEGGYTPVWMAAADGNEAMVKALLEAGANVEAKDSDGNSPLVIAVSNGHKDVARLLLEKGANMEAKTSHGSTPVLLAAANGDEDVLRLLLYRGALLEAKSQSGKTPLWVAAGNGHADVALLLLIYGADIEVKSGKGNTPLMIAVIKGHEAVVRLLINRGADTKQRSRTGESLLQKAVRFKHKSIESLLLEHGADIGAKDGSSSTQSSEVGSGVGESK